MGIKKFDKKYSTPRHMWRGERVKGEAEIIEKYGLKNHKEVWKVLFALSRWRELARHFIISKDLKGTDELLNPLMKIGCLKEKKLESVFEISPNDVFERRLQTIVFRKGLARTIRQARHLISHKHIRVDNKVIINVPGYIVDKGEESNITCDIVINPKTSETSTDEKETPTKTHFAHSYKKKRYRSGNQRKIQH